MTYIMYTDNGHGWLEVTKSELAQLGITAKISGWSYHDNGKAYLEEDCDLSVFIKAKGWTKWPQDQITTRHTDGNSFVRSLPHYAVA